jgi:hypothetical protein
MLRQKQTDRVAWLERGHLGAQDLKFCDGHLISTKCLHSLSFLWSVAACNCCHHWQPSKAHWQSNASCLEFLGSDNRIIIGFVGTL